MKGGYFSMEYVDRKYIYISLKIKSNQKSWRLDMWNEILKILLKKSIK